MLVLSIGIAYFISKYVTRSLETLRLQIAGRGGEGEVFLEEWKDKIFAK